MFYQTIKDLAAVKSHQGLKHNRLYKVVIRSWDLKDSRFVRDQNTRLCFMEETGFSLCWCCGFSGGSEYLLPVGANYITIGQSVSYVTNRDLAKHQLLL